MGGWPGYFEFLEVKADACDPGHDDMLEWHWENFALTAFDGQRVNQRLINIKA
ncbi:hypothetical protein [Pseudomonas psychrophila]|uniref:hypothetical protein n=1 Tax=Pseudomonas psychrophila TaxID=122355 RepID=UPI003825CE7C